jgi:hypothetical protein
MMSELERIMEKRLVKGSQFPPWFTFETTPKILGKVVGFRKHPVNPNNRVATIRTLNNEEYSVTLSTVLERLFTEQGVKEGDFVYIVYEGLGKSKAGRRVKLFSLAKMTPEEAERYTGIKAQPPPEAPPEIPRGAPIEEKAQKVQPEVPPAEVKLKIPEEKAQKVREYFSKLLEFYDDGLTEEQARDRISKRFGDLTLEDVLGICDFMRYDDKSKRYVKR